MAPDPTPPPAALDEAKLNTLIETQAKTLFDKWKAENPAPPPGDPKPPAGDPPKGDPAAPAAPAGDLAAQINAAVASALRGRDNEDQLALLHQEIEGLKAKVLAAPAKMKRNWATLLVGMGIPRV
jgi:hypothetical protein